MTAADSLLNVLIQWGAWMLVIVLSLAWLGRTRHRLPERNDTGILLRSPPVMLWAGLFVSVAFTILAVVLAITAEEDRKQTYFWMFFSLAMIGLPVLVEYFVDSYVVKPDGLQYRTLMAGEGSASWDDLVQVYYVSLFKWYRLLFADGRVVRVSAVMIGLPEFADVVLRQAPAGAVLPGAARSLRVALAKSVATPSG